MRFSIITVPAALLIILTLAVPLWAQEVDWVARFDGGGTINDIALAMAADASGNVYVAGYSYGPTGDDDVRLVKFSAAGEFLWTQYYSGGVGWDDARDLHVAADGTVTIVGFTTTEKDRAALLAQYAPDGTQNWLTTWDGGGIDDGKAIAVDDAGYIYVAIESDGPDLSDDIVTMRLTPAGEIDWVQRYAGAGGWNDVAADIAVTGAGVATVTGTARDASFDLIALQYESNGTLRWSDKYDPLGYSYEIGVQVALDDAGRAYIVGSELTAEGTNDICVLCYEADGTRAWVRTFDGDPDTYDDGVSLALGDDLVVVTGCSEVSTNDRDVRTIAFDMSGNQLWTDRFAGPMIRGDDCGEVALIHDDGLITVVATSDSLLTEEDFLTLRYTADGDLVWSARYNGPGNRTDEATGGVVLPNGAVLVGGVSPDVTVDFAVVKYAGNGGDDDTVDDDTIDDDTVDDDTVDDDTDDDDATPDDDDTPDDDTADDDDSASDDDDDNDDDDDDDGCGC
ncbi:MAG TPA: hypothetical protein PKW95_00200 [bacterium]|nr:hypothetical protein [bacterium]